MNNLNDEDKEEIEESLNESEPVNPDPEWVAKGPEEDYELEIYLSTDGKNTVHIKTNNPLARRNAIVKALETYEYLRTRFGTKQAQAVKEYGKERPEDDKAKQENCLHKEVVFKQSQTPKNPGRWFKQCKTCNKFLGWQS